MTPAQTLEPLLTWTGERLERGIRIEVDAHGRIEAVGRAPGAARADGASAPAGPLARHALLPGFVDAHSHAFQRGLRGVGEVFPEGAGSFWTWRQGMYALVEQMTPERMFDLASSTFRELRAAGVTSLGEFHYLHHADAEQLDFAFDEALLAAARAVGLRLVLLETYYQTGGIGKPLEPAQRRFATPDPATYWAQMERLERLLDPATQSLGAVVHSVRAAPPEALAALHAEARARDLVFHMHLEEQRVEIEDCLAAYGCTPLELVLKHCAVDAAFTAVHATHSRPQDLERLLERGAGVCLCPTTEANLGDGIADVPAMLAHGERVSIGSDSNARIDFLEELRWMELVQRLARERRGVCSDAVGDVGRRLLDAGTRAGARALGLDVGRIEPGAWADFVAIDTGAPALAGCTDETLLAATLLGADGRVVAGTCVGGAWSGLDGGAA